VSDDPPRLTHGDKILWPGPGYTKADLWRYYEAVADRLLAQVRGRPLTLVRWNRGVDGDGFVQKNLPDSAPAWLSRHVEWTPSSGRQVAYALAEKLDDLRWMANQNALELHEMLVTADRDDRADVLVFDLDPGAGAVTASTAAHWLREVLDELGLVTAVKTSGKRGLHLVMPVERRYDFATARLRARRGAAVRGPPPRRAHRGDAQGRPGRPPAAGLVAQRPGPDDGRAVEPAGDPRRDGVDAADLGRGR